MTRPSRAEPPPTTSGERGGRVVAGVLFASMLLLFVLPIAALFTLAPLGGIASAASDPGVRAAFLFTVYASAIAVAVSLLLGVPTGYLLARHPFPGRSVVESIVALPVMLPHLIAGIALLLLFSPTSPVGALARDAGIEVFGTIWGVVLVMVYLSAPYTVLASALAFRSIDPRLREAARCLGARPEEVVATVTVPLAARGIVTGAMLTWARSVSEIGGFLILANTVYPSAGYPGPVTSPISVYIYNLYQFEGLPGAAAVSALFVLFAFALFLAVRLLERYGRLPWGRGELIP